MPSLLTYGPSTLTRWVPQLSSIQKHFRYVLYQQGFFDVCFEVPAKQGMRKMVVSIELPRDFPSEPPVLRCRYERHTFVDGQNFIISPRIHPDLEKWKHTNDLGAILYTVCAQVFGPVPPTPVSPNWDSAYQNPLCKPLDQIKDNAILNRLIDSSGIIDAGAFAPTQSQLKAASSAASGGNKPVETPYVVLKAEDIAAVLAKKSSKEVENIAEHPEAFLNNWDKIEPLRKRASQREAAMTKAKNLDADTTRIQAQLVHQEDLVAQLLPRKDELGLQLAQLKAHQQHIESRHSKQAIVDGLLVTAQHDETSSENLASAFVRGLPDAASGKPLDVDSFLSKYLELRVSHRTRISKRSLLLSTPTQLSTMRTAPSTSSNASSFSYPSTQSSASSPFGTFR